MIPPDGFWRFNQPQATTYNGNPLAKRFIPMAPGPVVSGNPLARRIPFTPPLDSDIPAIARAPRRLGGPVLGSFKRGGKVKKTGLYKLHKGEKVSSLAELRK